MSSDQPFYGLTSKGLESADLDSVEKMAGRYVVAIRGVQPRGPYLVGGFSAGGVWAYEVARQLDQAGEQVGLLAMLDTAFPVDMRPPSGLRIARSILAYELKLLTSQPLGEVFPFAVEKLRRVSLRASRVVRPTPARRMGQGCLDVETEGPATKHDWADLRLLRAYRRYRPRKSKVPITLFWAADDRNFPAYPRRDPRTGWQDVACGGIRIQKIPGDHTSVLSEPHVHSLARGLTGCLTGGPWNSANRIEAS